MKTLKVRNKNAMKELLLGGADFEKISIVSNLDQDNQTKEILAIAKSRNIQIESTHIKKMEKRRSGQTKEVLMGFLKYDGFRTLDDLLGEIYERDEFPFFLLINRIDFESNIGVIARTAFAVGVNGLIFQGDEKDVLNDETLHYSLGAIARIPLVKMSLFDALKKLQKNGIKIFSLDMKGVVYHKQDLSGPVAFIPGAERKGLSEDIADRCDKRISIPMRNGIDSLNVGISTGIILYEKIRQDKIKTS